MIIAIDGPSGAGKSTIAKAVAKKLGFSCLDTGAMYRCVAWQALELGVSLDDQEKLGEIARTYPIDFGHVEGDPSPAQVFMGGVDVTAAIRTAQIDKSVSAASAVPAVREALVNQQRGIGSTNYEEVLADIIKRDEADSARATSPLRPAEDAVHLDSTGLTVDEVIQAICDLAAKADSALVQEA